MDRETRLREIADAAKQDRKRPSRALWVAALAVSVLCVAGLAIAWIEDRDTIGTTTLPMADARKVDTNGGYSGVVTGAVVGIVVGSLIAVRRRKD